MRKTITSQSLAILIHRAFGKGRTPQKIKPWPNPSLFYLKITIWDDTVASIWETLSISEYPLPHWRSEVNIRLFKYNSGWIPKLLLGHHSFQKKSCLQSWVQGISLLFLLVRGLIPHPEEGNFQYSKIIKPSLFSVIQNSKTFAYSISKKEQRLRPRYSSEVISETIHAKTQNLNTYI